MQTNITTEKNWVERSAQTLRDITTDRRVEKGYIQFDVERGIRITVYPSERKIYLESLSLGDVVRMRAWVREVGEGPTIEVLWGWNLPRSNDLDKLAGWLETLGISINKLEALSALEGCPTDDYTPEGVFAYNLLINGDGDLIGDKDEVFAWLGRRLFDMLEQIRRD